MPDVRSYKKRYFKFGGIWSVGDTKLKTYLITPSAEISVPGGMWPSARDHVATKLTAIMERESAGHGLGYVILHLGEMRNWLLVHWWAFEDIVLQTISSTRVGEIEFICDDHQHFHACVWEQIVIGFERDAWVGQMMCDKGAPENYLKDRLADGDY